jgi:DUF1016 N-terminal domain
LTVVSPTIRHVTTPEEFAGGAIIMTPVSKAALPAEYPGWLDALKTEIRQAQGRTALTVNAEMIHLYWRIGREILKKQANHGWGGKVVDRLADDLRKEFPQ